MYVRPGIVPTVWEKFPKFGERRNASKFDERDGMPGKSAATPALLVAADIVQSVKFVVSALPLIMRFPNAGRAAERAAVAITPSTIFDKAFMPLIGSIDNAILGCAVTCASPRLS